MSENKSKQHYIKYHRANYRMQNQIHSLKRHQIDKTSPQQ